MGGKIDAERKRGKEKAIKHTDGRRGRERERETLKIEGN